MHLTLSLLTTSKSLFGFTTVEIARPPKANPPSFKKSLLENLCVCVCVCVCVCEDLYLNPW